MKKIFSIVLCATVMLTVAGCDWLGRFGGGSDVAGYEELGETLSGADLVRRQFFEAAAAYERVQIVFEQVVLSADTPGIVKTRIQTVDAAVTAALLDYHDFAARAPDDVGGIQTRMAAAMAALTAAQSVLVDLVPSIAAEDTTSWSTGPPGWNLFPAPTNWVRA